MEARLKSQVRSDWTGAILVCGKCTKRVGGGFGDDGRSQLAKLLRRALGGKGRGATVGVVETKCLGICPKSGVVVIDAARLGQWQVVAAGTPVVEVLDRLGRAQA